MDENMDFSSVEKLFPNDKSRNDKDKTLAELISETHQLETEKDNKAENKSILSALYKWNDIETLATDTEYLLDKLIPAGAITLLFGKGGIGKTSVALQIIHCIAEGKEFAGLKTKQTPVCFIDLENPLSVLKERIKHIGQSDHILIWHGSCEPPPARLDKDEYACYFHLTKGLLVFDTLRASFLGDENSSRDIALIISRLKELRDKGFTILLLHHTPKSNDGIYKGSTAILDLVDHALCLEPVKSNDDDPVDFDLETTYRFGVKAKTRFEPFSLHLQFDPSIKGFKKATDPDDKIATVIYDILMSGKIDGMKQNEIIKAAKESENISTAKIRSILKKYNEIMWESQAGGQTGKAIFYRAKKTNDLMFQHIYTQNIKTLDCLEQKACKTLDGNKSLQALDNSKYCNDSEGVKNIKTFNSLNDSVIPKKTANDSSEKTPILDLTNEKFEVI